MTYNAFEVSTQDGRPVRLYEFKLGNTAWFYTNADRTVTYPGSDAADHDYLPVAITDGGITQDVAADGGRDFLVTLDASLPVSNLLRGTPPSSEIALIVRQAHYDDTSDETIVCWTGSVLSRKQIDDVQVQLSCQVIGATLRRGGLRLTWSRGCNLMLYACGVPKEDFAVTAVITALTGSTLTAVAVGSKEATWFDGGFLTYDRGDGSLEHRGIVSSIGNTIALLTTTDGLNVGDEVTLYPGCAHVPAPCQTKFNNFVNYGGLPHLSQRSPFDGKPVF